MTRYEYRERIKELKEERKAYKELYELSKVSAMLSEQACKAYQVAFLDLSSVAQTEDNIRALTLLNKKLTYINLQYKEHLPSEIGN